MKADLVVAVGMGEVGKPLVNILRRTYDCREVDIEPVEIGLPCSVLHICYPFQIPDFCETTAGYVNKYHPDLTIINSTVAPGTTDKIWKLIKHRPLAYSPVRGKHAKMERDMLHYQKFVAGCDAISQERAAAHFSAAGFKVSTFSSVRLAELSKLLETTYLGILIAWAQEVERMAQAEGGSFEDVNAFIKEIGFLPSHIFPGVIGGHCVMPNIQILRASLSSRFLDAVVESNRVKEEQLQTQEGSKLCSTSA